MSHADDFKKKCLTEYHAAARAEWAATQPRYMQPLIRFSNKFFRDKGQRLFLLGAGTLCLTLVAIPFLGMAAAIVMVPAALFVRKLEKIEDQGWDVAKNRLVADLQSGVLQVPEEKTSMLTDKTLEADFAKGAAQNDKTQTPQSPKGPKPPTL